MIYSSLRKWRVPVLQFCFLLLFPLASADGEKTDPIESPETLFRRAASAWQSSGTQNYQPFDQLAQELDKLFHTTTSTGRNNNHRLEVVGAMEESILVLERFVFEQDQGREHPIRDQTLSKLYTVYAKALSHLTSPECMKLAMDPHTLLIGADTATKQPPTTTTPTHQLCLENADNAARNAATLDATNQQADELLRQLNSGTVHERKPKEFVAELFDSFADSFDQKLLQNLEYKVPSLVGNLTRQFLRLPQQQFQNALDAGSGTGLAGRYLRPMVEHNLVGVDASPKMLDIAAKCTRSVGCGLDDSNANEIDKKKDDRPLYNDLIVMDLEEMTISNTLHRNNHHKDINMTGFDLIVAADVLVYFGSLENLLKTFATVSEPGAVLVFSCEKATEEEAPLGWRLLSSGRFSHTKHHAVEVASKVGYRLEHYQDIVPRMEKGEPVKGHLFGFVLSVSLNKEGEGTTSDEL
jgi:predicted TPR repeat methyltransferase